MHGERCASALHPQAPTLQTHPPMRPPRLICPCRFDRPGMEALRHIPVQGEHLPALHCKLLATLRFPARFPDVAHQPHLTPVAHIIPFEWPRSRKTAPHAASSTPSASRLGTSSPPRARRSCCASGSASFQVRLTASHSLTGSVGSCPTSCLTLTHLPVPDALAHRTRRGCVPR